ncbi:unnamed protein product [Pelagomonas calceolata]|uniref:Uncharacterized protein n=2 Tax=Pelagomonas calceolata TaxID=35677 RepID=A0A8J2SFB8_9STRA|nr:unnamed protein product [Pelagomonas calceolata]
MKAEIWAEVGDAVAGGGPTPKLEAALGNILAGRSNHFPRPPPQKRAPSDTSSDASSLQSKENRSPRRRLRRDLLPSDSDVSEPPTPTTKPASDFFRRAARRAYAPKEDPRLQLRRALVDALLKCADATAAAQLVRNDGPAALNCERAELWVAKASTNEEHWSCDDDKALAEAAAVSCEARQGSSDRRAWPVAIDQEVVGVLEIRGAPWPFDPTEGVELAEACAAPLRRSAEAVAHAREVETYERRVEELQDKGRERKQRLADALRAGERERERRGEVEDALRAATAATDALRADFRRSLSCQNDAADWAAARKDAAGARAVADAARAVLRAKSDAAAVSTASRDDREAALRAATRAMRAAQDRQDATKDAALRTTLAALAADGRAALEARDAAEDARARAEHEKTRAEEKYQRAEEMLRNVERDADARISEMERACEDRVRSARDAQRAQHAAGAAAAREVVELRRLLDEERLIRRDEAAWRAAGEERLRQRRLVAVATAMRRAHGRWRRERLQEALAVWIEDITITARVAAIAQRVALRVHGAPPNWWTPAVENAARQLARRVDAAEAGAAASRAAGALAAEETRRERSCGGAVALAAQKAAERASRLFAAAATGDEAALVKAVRDGAAAIAASDAEVTLFGGAQCGTVSRRETSLQIPADHGPLGLVATGVLDAAGRAELEAWCLLTGRALEQARALQAAAKSLREASANAARAVRAADATALEAVDGARRAGGVLDAVAAGGDVEELVAAALDDGGADEIRARVVVPTAGSWEFAVCDRTPVGGVEAHGSAWCAPVRNGCLVVHAARPRPEHYAALVAKCAAIASRTRSKPAPRRARLRTLLRRAATLTQRRAWARWRSHVDLSTRGELAASEARGVELGLAADAAHRACGALARACDQRRLAHAFASVEHCARRCASAAAVAAGAAACARLGQKARAWRSVAKDGRARTKEALGDLEMLKTQLEEARAAEARAATLAVRARELEADRRKLRDEIATRDAAQRLGRLELRDEIATRDAAHRVGRLERERRPSVSPLSPATARRRSPSPRGFRSVAFAEATPPPRASLTPSDESLSSAAQDRRDALALRAAELEARQRGVRDALATHRSRTPTPTTTTSSSSSDSLVSRTLRVLRDQLSPERPDSSSSSPVEEA